MPKKPVRTSGNTFFCFSPQVMLATFIIELALAVFVLLRYTMKRPAGIGVLILLLLASFQLAEYGACENFGLPAVVWAKLGFGAITLLPPLGLHLVYNIAGKNASGLVRAAYAASFAWILAFLTTGVMDSPTCGGNYVIFHVQEPLHIAYYTYYDVLLLVAMWQSILFSTRTKSAHIKNALRLLVLGYASFILPSLAIMLIYGAKGPGNALPSVMCGFAVLFAVILSFGVIPRVSGRARS